MIAKSAERTYDKDNPFKDCKLKRERYAKILTEIVKSSKTGFVMAINNKWGTGKTTFVKMWQHSLEKEGIKTVYFNSWENDFEDNPLVALMGEMKSLTQKSTERKYKSVLQKAAVLGKNIIPLAAQSLGKRYLDMEKADEILKAVSESAGDIFEKEVSEYATKKKGIVQFRKELEEFILKTNDGNPIVFIIDELDRCRPNYAVSILEQIKHFFSVSGITFILSIDKEQLGHAVCGVYGSQNMDSIEYLRRFIDIEYSIPDPDISSYVDYLYDYHKFEEFFQAEIHKQDFKRVAKLLLNSQSIPLRKIEKLFSHVNLILRAYFNNITHSADVIFFLVFIKFNNYEFLKSIVENRLQTIDFQQELFKMFNQNFINDNLSELIYLESILVYHFEIYKFQKIDNLYRTTTEGAIRTNELRISSVFAPHSGVFQDNFKILEQQGRIRHQFSEYLKNLELLENFKDDRFS